jgi:Bacterial PH domain
MNSVDMTISKAAFYQKGAIERYTDLVKSDLMKGEELIGLAAPRHTPKDLVYLTNKRLINYEIKGLSQVDVSIIPLDEIKSYYKKSGFIESSLEFHSNKRYISVEKVRPEIANQFYNELLDLVN